MAIKLKNLIAKIEFEANIPKVTAMDIETFNALARKIEEAEQRLGDAGYRALLGLKPRPSGTDLDKKNIGSK